MSADLHIHIATDNITDEHFRCFCNSTLGSKWCSGLFTGEYLCEDKIKECEDFRTTHNQFKAEFPEWGKKALIDAPKNVTSRWSELLGEHYKRVGYSCRHHTDISNTPNIWVGEVSWLKAALFKDGDTFIPSPIQKIYDLIGEDLPVIDDKFIADAKQALSVKNSTKYSLSNTKDIIDFLKQHKGMRCFTVSW